MDDIKDIEIDLNAVKNGKLNEGFLRSFGYQVEYILKHMFGLHGGSARVTGTKEQLMSFGRALSGEKRYMDSFNRHGLGDERTFKSKWELDRSIQNFEKDTGIKWPLK